MQAQEIQAPRIEVGRRVRYFLPYGNRVEGLIVAIRGKITGEKPRPGVMQFIRDGQAQFDVITFDGLIHKGCREHDVGRIGIGSMELLDRTHTAAMIERAHRLVAERVAATNLAAITARENFERTEAARVIENAPLLYWNGIKDAKGEKLQGCYYSGKPGECITIYGIRYRSFSAAVRACFAVENNSDSMTDYFENDRIRVIPAHPLYPQVKAALEAQDAHREKMGAKRRGAA